jgi:hypothetical protein
LGHRRRHRHDAPRFFALTYEIITTAAVATFIGVILMIGCAFQLMKVFTVGSWKSHLWYAVVGWHGKPRNKASSDSWVHVDKYVVEGKDYDDAGLPHTFTATADGTVTLLVNRSPVLEQKEAKHAREEITGKPFKLLRRRTPIEGTYAAGHDGGGIKLEWSTPLQPRQPIPTACLYPVISF